jgi:tetratricopeptide (TPR) repeat protein
MRSGRVPFLTLCACLVAGRALAGPGIRPADPALHALLIRGIECAGHQQYRSARALFEEAIRTHPDHPAGYLNEAILLEVMSLDFETPVDEPVYDRLLEKTIDLAERMRARDEHDPEALYYLGMAHSYIAYHEFRDGAGWLSGLSHGLTAKGYLQDCLDADPEAYDAMTGLGIYKYWKSRRAAFLTWTPFVDDERYAGINLLRIAGVRGTYTAAQATNALVWMYIDAERFDDAAHFARVALRRYPSNRLFLWGLASAAERKRDWEEARDAYIRIVASIDDEVRERRYIEIQARAKIALASWNLGDTARAKAECSWVLAHPAVDPSTFTADGAERIAHRIADMRDLADKLRR